MAEPGFAGRGMTWTVQVIPPVQGDVRWRARLLERVRAELRDRLRRAPGLREMVLTGSHLEVRLQHLSGSWHEQGELRLQYVEEKAERAPTARSAAGDSLRSLALPDAGLERLAERLVGLDRLQEEILLRLRCQWDGLLDAWSEQTGSPVPPPVRAQLEESVPFYLLSGPPGVGKSALAQVVSHRFCAETGTGGRLYWLDTGVRGNGLVGDFGNRVRGAFQAVAGASGSEPVFLILDEGDALAMRRNETHAHQEDRAATATLLQALDGLRGRRVAVFLTTNLPGTLDPAVRRRGTGFALERPDRGTLRELLARCFPQLTGTALARAATQAAGMTPADIERVALRVSLEAIRAGTPVSPRMIQAALRCGERTDDL